MKNYPIALFLLSMTVASIAFAKSAPNGIQSIVGGEAFWDGGSVILEFTDFDERQWQAFLNKSLGEKKEKRKDSITVTKLTNGFGEKVVRQEGRLLKKGSKEEEIFLSFLSKAIGESRVENAHALEMATEFLKKKRELNQAVEDNAGQPPPASQANPRRASP